MQSIPRATVRFKSVLVASVCCMIFSSNAWSQQASNPRNAAEARTHFEAGVSLMQAGRWVEALPEFERARELQATPPVLYNLGLAQRAVGRVRDARTTFQALISTAGTGLSAERTNEIRGYLTELEAAVGHLDVRVAPNTARVVLDGNPIALGETEVDPGRHELVIEAAGYRTERRTMEVRRGASAMIDLRLEREEVRRRVTVECDEPTATVRIDSQPIGQGNAETDLAPGPHVLAVDAPGFRGYRREIRVEDANVRLRVSLERLQTPRGGIGLGPIIGIGAGVVAAGVLTGVLIWALSGTEEPFAGTWGTVARGQSNGL